MAIINTNPVKQKVYAKQADGSLSPVSYWGLTDTIELPNGTLLSDYLEKMGNGGTIYVVEQADTTDITTAAASLGITTFHDGQMIIIVDPNEKTAGYVYKNNKWIAFSGNINAENVIFSDDILCAGDYTQVGNVSKTKTGTYTMPAKNKSLADIMRSIFTKEIQPTKTEPNISVSLTNSGYVEVGTDITPTYNCIFNPGSYTYDASTGVTITSCDAVDSDGNTATGTTGTFSQITVGDTTNYSVSVSLAYSDGNIANTNIGNPSNPEVKIIGKTISKSSASIVGYRPFYYGITSNTSTIDSALIKSLTNGGNYNSAMELPNVVAATVSDPKRIIVAIPDNSTRSGLVKVVMPSALFADVTAQYVLQPTTVLVEGKNGYTAVPYKVWVYEPASLSSTEVHTITLG